MFELPPNLWARSGPMEGTRTEDRRPDDLNGGGYAPLGGEAFCRPVRGELRCNRGAIAHLEPGQP